MRAPRAPKDRFQEAFGSHFAIFWLYFCVLAISSSNDEQYHYHEHLVYVVNEQYPELLPWIPEMYKELNATPPVPKQISMEDFNES